LIVVLVDANVVVVAFVVVVVTVIVALIAFTGNLINLAACLNCYFYKVLI